MWKTLPYAVAYAYIHIYTYIFKNPHAYIYMCVCVCMCVCQAFKQVNLAWTIFKKIILFLIPPVDFLWTGHPLDSLSCILKGNIHVIALHSKKNKEHD